jgi:hypothetical protein
MLGLTCPCGNPLPRRDAKLCRPCRAAARKARRRSGKPRPKPCVFCSLPHTRGNDRQYCGPICRKAYYQAWDENDAFDNRHFCPDCKRQKRTPGRCHNCNAAHRLYRSADLAFARASGRNCVLCGDLFMPTQASDAYKGKIGKYCHTCRSISDRIERYGVAYEYVNPVNVFARDGWRCQHCGCDTPKALLSNTVEPNAPTLDHILPLSKGGAHSTANTQCLCRYCNGYKAADTTKEPKLQGVVDFTPFTTARNAGRYKPAGDNQPQHQPRIPPGMTIQQYVRLHIWQPQHVT